MPPRFYPALDVAWPAHPGEDAIGRVLAALDNGTLAAVEDAPLGCRVFFHSSEDRDVAASTVALAAPHARVAAVDVSDDAWAERSQAGLTPVTVGSLVIAPPWCAMPETADPARWIVIEPSMGFGTGHHQTTRLCLRLLQKVPLVGRSVLDVGTGSGVLAIAAARLGARRVLAVDYDREAIACATDNVRRNNVESRVDVRIEGVGPGPHDDWDSPSLTPEIVKQLTDDTAIARGRRPSPAGASDATPGMTASHDVVVGNLTGATLLKAARSLAAATAPEGLLIVSGFQYFEEEAVQRALATVGFRRLDGAREDDWVGLVLMASPTASTTTRGRSQEPSQP
jgi:ribosomal protein L11 methyltransferase